MNTFKFPRWDQLPELDLYMDQVITYLTEKLKHTYFSNEKIVTNSMINNYVKTGIVPAPIKKHYTRQHVAYFLIITILKRCYSMQQIERLIHIYTDMKNTTIENAYDLFITRFEDSLNVVFESNLNTNNLETKNPEQDLMDNVIQSIIYKIHSEYELKRHEIN